MKKTETIEAIDKLIKKYSGNRFHYPYGDNCPLCNLSDDGTKDNYCINCINYAFIHCTYRAEKYTLNHYTKKDYPNLAKFWTNVNNFFSPLEEEINIEDIKEHILTIAKPFKK